MTSYPEDIAAPEASSRNQEEILLPDAVVEPGMRASAEGPFLKQREKSRLFFNRFLFFLILCTLAAIVDPLGFRKQQDEEEVTKEIRAIEVIGEEARHREIEICIGNGPSVLCRLEAAGSSTAPDGDKSIATDLAYENLKARG